MTEASELPPNLHYTAAHEWIDDADPASVGITAHAAEELGEIVYVELPQLGPVTAGDACGEIESTKAVSEIYSPATGEIVEVNDTLADAPEQVGDEPYGQGWLFRIKVSELGEVLTAEQYAAGLDS
ncbi:MAG: glycine cleavage system protein GcvH [Actinomycetota bacterium]